MNQYKSGDYLAVCDSCGFEFHASKLKKRWDGFYVCEKDWETRHPQDFVRGRKENSKLPWSRPEPADTFITVSYVASTVGEQYSTIPSGNNDGSL